MKLSHTISPVFDDPNLIGAAGLVPAMLLARSAGLHELAETYLDVDAPNVAAKTSSIVAGMLAGADSIDDLDVLRHGAMCRLFGGVRAPSTLGTYLRTFTPGQVAQVDAVATRFLTGLASRVPGLVTGAADRGGIAFLDVDDTIGEVHGYAKQGAAYGYSGVKGLNAQLAVVSTPLAAPVIAAARLRRGNTVSHAGSGQLVARALATARRAGVHSQVLVRADSAYYTHDTVAAVLRAGAWFSITVRKNPQVTAAIAGIACDAWQTIEYPNAVYDQAEQRWVSDAEVAEVDFTCFTSKKKSEQVSCRLVVRRVKRVNPAGQDGLFETHRHHGFITNSTLGLIAADEHHRDHALVEQVIAELKDGPLAHLPSGKKTANGVWLMHAVMAFNLARALAVLAGHHQRKTRWATVRSRLINLPARLAASGRRITLHLPSDWPWATAWTQLYEATTGPPRDHQWTNRADRKTNTPRPTRATKSHPKPQNAHQRITDGGSRLNRRRPTRRVRGGLPPPHRPLTRQRRQQRTQTHCQAVAAPPGRREDQRTRAWATEAVV